MRLWRDNDTCVLTYSPQRLLPSQRGKKRRFAMLSASFTLRLQVVCTTCEEVLTARDIAEHVYRCSCRTIQCEHCGQRYIALGRYLDADHQFHPATWHPVEYCVIYCRARRTCLLSYQLAAPTLGPVLIYVPILSRGLLRMGVFGGAPGRTS